ncbi:TraR/DksA C4-type zinc finger protein [Natranaerobius thermophilus]|uniref:Transcriptional regulator, TraR/DksA family n=1 Tax=Natranaerobius thermophilus (strain ATCC BAA-1301 / DSM 18059 / JW/NM-WN-LF) TaxID=457570 RepID=B2A2J0_NATTJ|nr:TraR/DksA C4-type zinc finger protein [Natranaerobius thermophilus]ACB84905.1 transcriptional regulator, TraR/DksA family [Natranaerobius thermophilus JW/NM-WN-LF]
MTDQEIEKYRQKLLSIKADLEKHEAEGQHDNRTSIRDNVSELSSYDNHPGDLGSEQYELEKDTTLSNLREQKLREIEIALEKIANGDYGKCESCGKEINNERLDAVPYTRYCISCLGDLASNQDEHPYFEGHTHLETMSSKDENSIHFDKEDMWQKLENYGQAGGTNEDYENSDENWGAADKMDEYSIGGKDLSINPKTDPERFKRRKRRGRNDQS